MSGVEIVKIGGVIAFVLPPVIAVIVKTHWSSQFKGAIAFAACVIAALVMVLYEDAGFDWHDWRNASLFIFSAAMFFYHTFWKPSQIAPKLEAATT